METGLSNSIEKADTLILNIFSDLSDSMKDANKTISIWKEVLYSIKMQKLMEVSWRITVKYWNLKMGFWL